MEMYNDNKLVSCARLIEAVFDVAETNVNFLTLRRRITQTVLVDLQVTDGFLADQVRADHKVVQLIASSALVLNQLLELLLTVDGFDLLGCLDRFELGHTLLDLLAGLGQSVVGRC